MTTIQIQQPVFKFFENGHCRQWLEKNCVGKWHMHWIINRPEAIMLDVEFDNQEDATLFALKWS